MMDNLTESNSTNFTDKLSNSTVEGETRNTPLNVNFVVTVVTYQHYLSLHSFAQRVGDNGREKKTKTSDQRQHLAGLFSGDCRRVNWTHITASVCPVENKAITRCNQLWSYSCLSQRFCTHPISVCWCLHLTLVTCERLLAIKFTMLYHEIVTKRKTKVAVLASWIFSISCHLIELIKDKVADLLAALVLISCFLFIASAYAVLYLETRRHRNIIKTRQLPQDEVERFVEESNAVAAFFAHTVGTHFCYVKFFC